jgi:hypothetical protein
MFLIWIYEIEYLNNGGCILVTRDINYKELFIVFENGRTMLYVREYYKRFTEFSKKAVKYIPFCYLLVKIVVDMVPTVAVGETLSYV